MAKDKDPLEAFTATVGQTAEQMTKQTQKAMENYFGWLWCAPRLTVQAAWLR